MSAPVISTLLGLRKWLRDSIVAAGLGLAEDAILLHRQGDFWNDVAMAINTAENRVCLKIEHPQGRNTDQSGARLDLNLTITLTLLCEPETDADAVPEEPIFEALMHHIHGLKIPSGPGRPCVFHFLVEGFGEMDVSGYLARQIIVAKRHILDPPATPAT